MKIAVIPTGRTEWHGLAPALQRLFPDGTFYSLPDGDRGHLDPYPGFTSVTLTDRSEADPPESARDLVARAAQEALGDRRRAAADRVPIVDDLELPNAHQPERVVRVMRRAVEEHLASLSSPNVRARTEVVLRERVSFHLIAPMIEAWFFADAAALKRLGVANPGAVVPASNMDPEVFVTDDPDYVAATEQDCPRWCAPPVARSKKHRPKWLGSLDRTRHPKGYLQWLCRAPNEKSCTSYDETRAGGLALQQLDWQALFGRDAAHFSLLRALAEDLASDLSPTTPIRQPVMETPTRVGAHVRPGGLRNV